MEFQVREISNVDILVPVGRIDASCSSEVRDRMALMVQRGSRRMVIDLSEVHFIDSSGLGMLVSGLRLAKKTGGALKLAALNADLKHLFECTRLDRLFEIFADVDQAVQSFRSP